MASKTKVEKARDAIKKAQSVDELKAAVAKLTPAEANQLSGALALRLDRIVDVTK